MYNITGWSGGGRRPLTYNLMPGQFRNTRVNVFPSQTIINNNIGNFGGCYDYGHCGCDGGSSTPKWMNWMMGIGFGTSLLGSILGMFGGGGGGGAAKADTATDEFASLKTLYPKNTFSKVGDTYVCVTKDGKQIRGKSPDELLNKLGGGDEGAGELSLAPTATENDTLKRYISSNYPNIEVTDDGKFEVNGKKYDKLGDAIAALNKKEETSNLNDNFSNLLFKSGIDGLDSTEAEESTFKELTGSAPYKIKADANGITITEVADKGNNTTKTGSIKINSEQLTELLSATGKEITLSNFSGKTAKAKNLGGYLQIQVGNQTYIVGSDMKGYQYKDGNVTGYSEANWRRST